MTDPALRSATPRRLAGLLCLLWAGQVVAASTASTPAPACHAAAPTGPTYLLASEVDMVALLPPPPASDSLAARADLQAVIDAQHGASPAERAHAVVDSHASCARFDDVLGAALSARSNAALLAFLDRAAHEGASLIDPVKDHWKRSRPYVVSTQVKPLGDVAPGQAGSEDDSATASVAGPDSGATAASCADSAAAKPPSAQGLARQRAERASKALRRAHISFPSGHAAFGTVCAIVLADMLPERRAALFARAADFSHSRLVLGAHFPSDLEAGRLAGTVAAALLMQNARFQHDYQQARRQLRAALGLPTADKGH